MTARNISSIISMSFYWFPFNFRRYDHLSLQEQLYEEQPRKDFRIYTNFGQLWRLLGDIFLIYEIIEHKFRSFSIKELQIIFVLILKQEKPKKWKKSEGLIIQIRSQGLSNFSELKQNQFLSFPLKINQFCR